MTESPYNYKAKIHSNLQFKMRNFDVNFHNVMLSSSVFFPHLERVPVWSLLLALARPSPSSSYLGFEMIFPSQRIFSSVHGKEGTCPQAHRTPAHRWASPVLRPRRTGRSSSASGLGSPWLGEVALSDLVSQFYFHFGLELKEQQHLSNNICCLSKMIYLCLLKLFFWWK